MAFLQSHGLRLLERNYRVARGPSARGAEVDLIMQDADGTLVFVEVRMRSTTAHGGAASTVTGAKQRKCVRGAQYYLLGLPRLPPCRFDVIAIDGEQIEWLPAAFDAPS